MHLFTRPKASAPFHDKKQISFAEYAVDESSYNDSSRGHSRSPPLTSSLNSQQSASSTRETVYLHQASMLKWFRTGLSFLTAAAGLVVVGCTSHVLWEYDHTLMGEVWHLPLWPAHVDLKPALAMLVPASMVAVASLLYMAFAIAPSLHSRFRTQNLVFVAISTVGLAVTLFAMTFSHIVSYRHDAGRRETLQTYTCGLYDNARNFAVDGSRIGLQVSISSLVPTGFRRLCVESLTAYWTVTALFALEVICVAVAIIGVIGENKMANIRKSRYEKS